MRKVIWLDSAVNDLVSLRKFITVNNPKAAKRAAQIIKKAATTLVGSPNIGKPVADLPEFRDLYIKFGVAGYVMRYRIYRDDVYIVYIRHYREAGFKND